MHLIFDTASSSHHKEALVAALAGKYGSLEQLDQRVQISRCSDPAMVDDLVMWRSLVKPDTVFRETVRYESAEMLSVLTPRRAELLESLRKERNPLSVTALARKMRRDYKNVYDDVRALSEAGLLDKVKDGREVMVSTRVKRIVIAFEDTDISY